jgi:hypothetical protein
MRSPLAFRAAGAFAFALLLAACDPDGGPSGAVPTPDPSPVLTAVQCSVVVATHAVTCAKPGANTSVSPTLLVGGQGVYVQVTSSNVAYDGSQVFSFDVTVQNLLPAPQVMGTVDGTTLHANGVRIFFGTEPVVLTGSGNVSIANADGSATFTSGNQPYYQYDEVLSSLEVSPSKNWQFNLDNTVTSFGFLVYVAAEVLYPNGWIDVTPATPYMLEDTTTSLTGTVRTVVGNVVADPITWGTSDGAVATVDGSGTVTTLSPGNVSITATAGARTGAAAIAVCPNLDLGEVYTAVMPAAATTCFGGGSATEEFTYMPINLSTSSSLSLVVTGSGIQAVTGPPTPNRIPNSGLRAAVYPGEPIILDHTARLDREREALNPILARRSRTRTASQTQLGGARRIVTPNVVPTVGDLMDINTNSACSLNPSVRTGQVRSVSNHLIILGDTANPAGGFTTAQYDSIALEFDTIAWPVDSANFGAPTDLDNNGRVVAFFTRAVNELSPPASSSVVLGFFASKDVFGTDDCSNSNGLATVGSEIFYMLVPDPTGAVNSNVRTVSFVRGNTTGTLGHEFQHMINGMRRAYVTGASAFEQGYLNEGLSHAAEELMFYRTSVGLAPRQNIVVTNLTTGANASRRVAAFNTYANQNFGRLRSWLQRPDTAGAFKANQNSLAVRGVIWAFLRYASDRVNGNDQAFWFSLVNSNLEGKVNIQNAIGGTDPDTWLRDFTAAMYLDDSGVTGVATVYTQPSWSFRSLYTALNGSYQLVPRQLTNNTGLTLSYSAGGGTAYTRFGVPASSFASLTALSGGLPPTSPYALIVTRTK